MDARWSLPSDGSPQAKNARDCTACCLLSNTFCSDATGSTHRFHAGVLHGSEDLHSYPTGPCLAEPGVAALPTCKMPQPVSWQGKHLKTTALMTSLLVAVLMLPNRCAMSLALTHSDISVSTCVSKAATTTPFWACSSAKHAVPVAHLMICQMPSTRPLCCSIHRASEYQRIRVHEE